MGLKESEVDDLLMRQEIRTIGTMLRDREAERMRIARDLHDRLGGMLSAAKFKFSVLGPMMVHTTPDQHGLYQGGLDLLDRVVNEVRRISMELSMSSSSHFGLRDALEDLQAGLRALNTINVNMNFHGLGEGLDQRLEMSVYSIVQNCISNVLKHAKAATLTVQLTRGPAMLNILVEDDGLGSDPADAGQGKVSDPFRKDVAELRGTVNIDRRPGRGTTVSIDIPLIATMQSDP